jgi:hypothetical protein
MILFEWMERLIRLFRVSFACLFIGISILGSGTVRAADPSEGERERQSIIVVSYTRYEWWLLRWSDNQIVCHVYIDHEGWPTTDEVLTDCGYLVYNQWLNTQPCTGLDEGILAPTDCIGLYLFFYGNSTAQKEVAVKLPPSQVFISLSDCLPVAPENLCPTIPKLHFSGDEPLPNEEITLMHVKMDGIETTCQGSVCDIQLRPTNLSGMTVEFWADSSFGDSSEVFTALIRVIDSGVSATPTSGGWYIDVISTQWVGSEIATCAGVWQAFPPVGGVPDWLTTPEDQAFLVSEEPYAYLAGRLISEGVVDASTCPNGGLLTNGYADTCGLEVAMPEVIEWQNQFDGQIMQIATDTKVPAQLLKNLFAQESQFWPGVYRQPNEYGLGQITDNGADSLLLWNPSFYNQFCPLVLLEDQCSVGYLKLDAESRAILRGALATSVDADCATCEFGIDLTTIDESITLAAHSLLANCDQVAQIVYNATGQLAGKVTSYEELWKFTIADYHVGPGCLSYAIYTSWASGAGLDWEHVSNHLTEPCETAIPYVTQITTSP